MRKISEAVGEQLAVIRQSLGLSQSVAAEKAGITQSQISHYETGKTRITLDAFVRICTTYGRPASDVLRDMEMDLVLDHAEWD